MNDLWINPAEHLRNTKGEPSFFWPVSRGSLIDVCYEFQNSVNQLIVAKDKFQSNDRHVLRLLTYELLRDVLVFFQWGKYFQHSEENKIKIHHSSKYESIKALVSSQEIPLKNPTFEKLKKGMKKPPVIPLFFRALYDSFEFQGPIYRKRLHDIKTYKDIVAFTSNPFMDLCARQFQDEKIKRCSIWEWFYLIQSDRDLINESDPIQRNMLESVISIIENIFENHHVHFSYELRCYFEKWMDVGSRLVRFYYLRAKNQFQIPRIFWFGSTNNVFTRIIRQAVSENGGTNVGFDHGRGMGLHISMIEMGYVFDLCEEYYSYSPLLTHALSSCEKEIKNLLPFRTQPLKFLSNQKVFLSPPANLKKEKTRNNSIMYLSRIYFNENSSGVHCHASNYVYLDWQTRIIEKFKAWGESLLYKGHPESFFPVDQVFGEKYDLPIINGYIENNFEKAGLYIFDFISSPFRVLAYTKNPIIFIDFGMGIISEPIRKVLQKRCVIVKGYYDENNRAQIDWDELRGAIQAARNMTIDEGSVRELFGSYE
jgi:hypothetical protein